MIRRILLILVTGLVALTFGGGSSAQPFGRPVFIDLSFGGTPTLEVELPNGNDLESIFVVAGGGRGAPPAKVAIVVPAAFRVALDAVGEVGTVDLSAVSDRGTSTTGVSVFGTISADAPAAYVSDPTAQACAPGQHAAVWRLDGEVLGFDLTVLFFLDRVSDGSTQIVFCPPAPRSKATGAPVGPPLEIDNLGLVFFGPIAVPSTRGAYLWRGFVTPFGPPGSVNEQGTYEVRGVTPIPQKLTLTGRYDRKTGEAVLSGRVMDAGRPRARAQVVLVAEPPGEDEPVHLSADIVRTNRTGRFALRIPLRRTARFTASTAPQITRCSGASSAPAGCQTTTTSAGGSSSVTIRVPPRRR